jgi:Flp pilus assembly protein TadG
MRDKTMKRNEKGQVLVFVALAIFALLGLAALGIDVGYMYSVRHELQRSADTGALAGASAFQTADWNLQTTKDLAEARAREFAGKDKVVQTTLAPGEIDVSFLVGMDRIEVITRRNASLFFARIFGMSNQLITARAVAQAKVVGSNLPVQCVKPWAIPYPWLDDIAYGEGSGSDRGQPNGTYDGQGTYNGVSLPGETVYDTCLDDVNNIGLCAGRQLIVKIGTPNDNTSPSGQQSAGQFFIIQGNLGGENWYTGGREYRDYIESGCFSLEMDKPLDLMTGDKVGPTKLAVQSLLDGDRGARWDDTLGRPTGGAGGYDSDDTWTSSPRVVRVAIYDPSVPMLGSADGNGTHTYVPTPYTLAGFWLEDLGPQGTVTGRYIPASAFGVPDDTPGPETGTEVKVLSLVE